MTFKKLFSVGAGRVLPCIHSTWQLVKDTPLQIFGASLSRPHLPVSCPKLQCCLQPEMPTSASYAQTAALWAQLPFIAIWKVSRETSRENSKLFSQGSQSYMSMCNAKNQLLSFFFSSLWPKGYIWYSWLTGTKGLSPHSHCAFVGSDSLYGPFWSGLPTSTELSQNYATSIPIPPYMCTPKTPCMFQTTNHFQFFKYAKASPSPGFLRPVLSSYNPCLISWFLLIFSNQPNYHFSDFSLLSSHSTLNFPLSKTF